MSKLKTRQSINKRYRRTRNGKILYKRPYKSHFLEKKPQKQKRRMRTIGVASKGDTKIIKTIMPF